MALEPPDLKRLNAAQGFCVLGMWEDANAELEEIDPFCRALPEVLEVRLDIYLQAERWDLMQVVASKLAKLEPEDPGRLVDLAYATRRVESIQAARAILLNAVERFPKKALIHYNLTCYDCQLGNLESAKERLKRAFELDPKSRLMALDDTDLKPLWETFR